MSEAVEGCALLEDVDEDTFVRFSQFAYTGDYDVAEPEILLDSSTIQPSPHSVDAPTGLNTLNEPVPKVSWGSLVRANKAAVEAVLEPIPDDNWGSAEAPVGDSFGGSFGAKRARKKSLAYSGLEAMPKSKKADLWDKYRGLSYGTRIIHKARKNGEPCEEYKEVFLSHARLYVFADKYGIDPLKRFSLHKLQRTLAVFSLYEERVGDIVQLLHWTYSNTRDSGSGMTVDDLRLLVVHYTACEIETLARKENFESLLEGNGAMGKDLVNALLERLD